MADDLRRITDSDDVSTVGEWLSGLQPPAPRALQSRIAELVKPFSSHDVSMLPELCLDAGGEAAA